MKYNAPTILLILFIVSCQEQVKPFSEAKHDDTLKQVFTVDSSVLYNPSSTFTCFESDRLSKIMTARGRMSKEVFKSLTAKEKFIYAFEYPESYSQLCSMPSLDTLERFQLHNFLKFAFDGMHMSDQQINGLKEQRDSTIAFIHNCLRPDKSIASAYKNAIVELGAWELIPDILNVIKNRKNDTYDYTVLMLLMKDNFPEFKKSDMHDSLYNDSTTYWSSLPLRPEYTTHIIDMANRYYRVKSTNK